MVAFLANVLKAKNLFLQTKLIHLDCNEDFEKRHQKLVNFKNRRKKASGKSQNKSSSRHMLNVGM